MDKLRGLIQQLKSNSDGSDTSSKQLEDLLNEMSNTTTTPRAKVEKKLTKEEELNKIHDDLIRLNIQKWKNSKKYQKNLKKKMIKKAEKKKNMKQTKNKQTETEKEVNK